MVPDPEIGKIIGTRHQVIHERARQHLTVFVIDHPFSEHLTEPLSDAAMDLSFDHHLVDDIAHVIDGGVADHIDLAGFGIDLDLADMAAIGKGHLGRDELLGRIQPAIEFCGQIHVLDAICQFKNADLPVGPLNPEPSRIELHIGCRRLEHMPGERLAFLDGRIATHRHGAARHHHGTGGDRGRARGHFQAVALDQPHL